MRIGEFSEKNNGAVIAIWSVAIAGICTIMMGCGGGGAAPAVPRWYYDIKTGEIVQFATYDNPPVTLPSGNPGYQAKMIGCGDCTGETFLGNLQRATPSMQDGSTGQPGQSMSQIADDPKLTDGKPVWVDESSPEGVQILQAIQTRCGVNVRTRECRPE